MVTEENEKFFDIFSNAIIKSGKWDAKQNAAIEYANQNNLNYKLLFTKDVEQFFNCLKR